MTTAITAPAERGASASGWLLVGGIVLASLTEAIAGTALSLGRADIIGDIHATPDEFAWLDVSYVGAKLTGLGLAPWLVARVEPRTLLLWAVLAMGAACGLAAITIRLDLLILLRAVQGLSGAVLLVCGQAMLFWGWPASRQPMLQAIFAMGAVVAPATLAPALQGWLIDTESWAWIFFCVLPLALAAAGLVLVDGFALPAPSPERRTPDWPGLALFGVAMFGTSWLLSQGSRWDWFETHRIVWLSVIAGASLLLFVLRQRRAGSCALLDLSVFRVGDFAFAFVVSFVAGAALFGSAWLIPGFAVAALGFTPTDAGLLLLPSGALFVAALLLAAWLMQARGIPPIATVPFGIGLIMVAMWMLSGSNAGSGAHDMLPAVLLRGLGLGFLFLSITLIAFGRLAPATLASGIAIFSIGRQLGGLIGVAWLQTGIDHQIVANQSVLAAALAPGTPALAERLGTMTSLLVNRGMETGAAARVATAMLGRAIGGQAIVIAFDTAFARVALLFVFAAPVVIAVKIALARTAKARAAKLAEAAS
ncbi:MFS transporter [Sphingomonas sp. DG1-23]|uniref:MFS transporter n=1 Tax=Sphingomonas sp. DG1-23 TaxID=3068316 RepID=UPI00273E9257|nr:MFS transporter [Sphingomonas sp. DG1-23]MDP5277454.1 MFS transporter [Sphingomonas sp. DG1-23]